jgi:hypothetical protein
MCILALVLYVLGAVLHYVDIEKESLDLTTPRRFFLSAIWPLVVAVFICAFSYEKAFKK